MLSIDCCCVPIHHPTLRTPTLTPRRRALLPARHSGAGVFHFQVRHEGSETRFRDHLFWTRGSFYVPSQSHGRQHVHFFRDCAIRRHRGDAFAWNFSHGNTSRTLKADFFLLDFFKRHGRGIQYVEHVEGHGDRLFEAVCKLGQEGIVSKKLDAPYRSRPR